MKTLPFIFLIACLPSPLEPLCSKGDVCGNNLDDVIAPFGIRAGDTIALFNGRTITVKVMVGMRVQRFSENLQNTDGICGHWDAKTSTITIAEVAGCGEVQATLLHEIGHAFGLEHARKGIMAMGYVGPPSREEVASLFRQTLGLDVD